MRMHELEWDAMQQAVHVMVVALCSVVGGRIGKIEKSGRLDVRKSGVCGAGLNRNTVSYTHLTLPTIYSV